MADIFIRYKREEQALARQLADALETEGWSVWWDTRLRAGERFEKVIEEALDEARLVIVFWSPLSVQSEFIRDESSGRGREAPGKQARVGRHLGPASCQHQRIRPRPGHGC